MGFCKKQRFWWKKNKRSVYKKRAEEAEMKVEELQDELKENERVMKQAVSMIRGTKLEVEEMLAARHGEMDTNQHNVQVHAEDFKSQEDLCIEKHKKVIEDLQDNLEEKNREKKQEVAILPDPICELEMWTAARDSEMFTSQQNVQVHVVDIKPQENLCATKLKFWGKKNKGSDYKKRVEEAEKKIEELQDSLKAEDLVMEQAVAMIRGTICEIDDIIAARDGEMDTSQHTVQVLMVDIKQQEDLCATNLRFWRKENEGPDYKKLAEETKKNIEVLQDRLKDMDRKIEQVVAMVRGKICEVGDMIAARDNEMETIQQPVQINVEVIKPQEDLCVEVLKNKIEEPQDNLDGKDRERKQEVFVLPGQICEREMWIAASDSEMNANQQTAQLHVEDFKPQEDLCAGKIRFWKKKLKWPILRNALKNLRRRLSICRTR